jgi:hypothetical protein
MVRKYCPECLTIYDYTAFNNCNCGGQLKEIVINIQSQEGEK